MVSESPEVSKSVQIQTEVFPNVQRCIFLEQRDFGVCIFCHFLLWFFRILDFEAQFCGFFTALLFAVASLYHKQFTVSRCCSRFFASFIIIIYIILLTCIKLAIHLFVWQKFHSWNVQYETFCFD